MAFSIGSELCLFKFMPMGLTHAPPTFQRSMKLVLPWKKCLINLDDVLVFSYSFADHIEVFSVFCSAGLMLKARNFQFSPAQVTFLGPGPHLGQRQKHERNHMN